MLVLGAYEGERLVLDGGRIVISVEQIRGNKVRLGFVAPRDVVIDRESVHESKLKEAADADRQRGS